jgi:uncharacterized protein
MYGYPFYKTPSSVHSNGPSTIEVLGEGKVTAAPDQAVVVLGVVTEGPALHDIQTENSKIVTNIIHSLQRINVPREKIQTHDYRIEAQYDYQDGKQIFRGYKVTHLLQISTDNVQQTGNLVDTAVSSGANEVTSIHFSMAKPEIYENQALSNAIRNAQQKALTIANSLGVTLLAVPNKVQELSRTGEPTPYMASKLSVSAITPIQPGQLTIKAMVRAWFLFA